MIINLYIVRDATLLIIIRYFDIEEVVVGREHYYSPRVVTVISMASVSCGASVGISYS